MLLAADVGGTKTAAAIYPRDGRPREPLVESTVASADYPNLGELLRGFLSATSITVDSACVAVAGPVVGHQARLSNLPWEVDEATLAQTLGLARVHLLNDVEALANAVPGLRDGDIQQLNGAAAEPQGAIAVVAPGTGLGEAFLVWDGTHYRAYPSEGGHADFAPVDALQGELHRQLSERFGRVSYERVCSGKGIPNIYTFLRDRGLVAESRSVAEALAKAADPTPIIVEAAFLPDGPCELCALTVKTFVSVLGAEAGNLALKVMATGGVYLGGGLSPRVLPALSSPAFIDAFRAKGRMSSLLDAIPVKVIVNPNAALLGAAHFGLTRM